MEINKKEGFVSYVLVCDVTDNSQLYYYCGYFKYLNQSDEMVPINTNDYTKAMKIPFKDEAELICEEINKPKYKPFTYHVEEHVYM